MLKPLLIVAIFALPQFAGYYIFASRAATAASGDAYANAALYFKTPERAVETAAALAAAGDWSRLAAYCESGCADLARGGALTKLAGAEYLRHSALENDLILVEMRSGTLQSRIMLVQRPKGLRLLSAS